MKHINLAKVLAVSCAAGVYAQLSVAPVRADDLDDLLNPSKNKLVENDQSVQLAWEGVVNAFRASDFEKANARGQAFLSASHQATPYQVLGVQMMISLAGGESIARATLDKDAEGGVRSLEAERQEIYNSAKAHRRTIKSSKELIDRLSNNGTRAIQRGSHNHQQALIAQQRMIASQEAIVKLEARYKELGALLGDTIAGADDKMKTDVLKLLQMLKDSNEVPAAFAICNVYLRKIGPDLDVAKFQQDFVRLQKLHDRAVKIVALIRDKQQPYVSKLEYWGAKRIANDLLVKVHSQSSDKELSGMVKKLMAADPLSIQLKISEGQAEAASLSKLAGVDSEAAKPQFKVFRGKYPDYPRLTALEHQLIGEHSTAKKNESAKLVAEIEDLIEESPEAALHLLATLDKNSLSLAEKQRLKVRISTVNSEVSGKLILSLDRDVQSAAKMLGGEVFELVNKGRFKARHGDERAEAENVQHLRARIDKSADKPKAVALLKRVKNGVDHLKELPLSSAQKIHLVGIEAQALSLLEACQPD